MLLLYDDVIKTVFECFQPLIGTAAVTGICSQTDTAGAWQGCAFFSLRREAIILTGSAVSAMINANIKIITPIISDSKTNAPVKLSIKRLAILIYRVVPILREKTRIHDIIIQ